MSFFPRTAAILAALCALASPVFAQMNPETFDEDPWWGSSVYHPYVFPEIRDTPAPKGFKPFYISHYGRHGSRHQTHSNSNAAYEILTAADREGILTEAGKALLRDVTILYEEHQGLEGELTPKGAREHRLLARRMKERFPAVFRDRNRKDVFCQSSNVSRCVVSMTHFTNSLQHEDPRLRFDFITGEKYLNLLAHSFYRSQEIFSANNHMFDSLLRVNVPTERIFKTFFIPDKARVGAVITDTVRFVKGLYTIGAICGCVEELGVNLLKTHLTQEEVIPMAEAYNNRIFGNYGHSIEFGNRCSWAARWLLEDFVNRADRALEDDSTLAVDLRFGHDTGILPLAALIRMEGFDVQRSRLEAHRYFDTSEYMPMASNIQMIFYRNRKGEVLVKMLYNEKETLIAGFPAYDGPYYRWSDLRAYFVSLCADKSAPVS